MRSSNIWNTSSCTTTLACSTCRSKHFTRSQPSYKAACSFEHWQEITNQLNTDRLLLMLNLSFSLQNLLMLILTDAAGMVWGTEKAMGQYEEHRWICPGCWGNKRELDGRWVAFALPGVIKFLYVWKWQNDYQKPQGEAERRTKLRWQCCQHSMRPSKDIGASGPSPASLQHMAANHAIPMLAGLYMT